MTERTIKQSTADGYKQRLSKLNNGHPVENYAFLYDINIMLDKIKDLKPTTQRNYIIAIVSALRDVPVMKSAYETYSKILDEYNTSLKKNNTKSDVQKENWVSQNDIEEVYKKISDKSIDLFCSKKKDITQIDWDKILETIILALYVLQPPRRILDYNSMIIVKKLPKVIDKNINYYDLSTDIFYYLNYKTSGTYKTQSFKAPSKLATLLDCYVKIHPLKFSKEQIGLPLLCKYDGSIFEKGYSITRILNRIFKKELGKRISVNLLRNIYLTSKFGPKVSELSDTASQMGTSSNTIENNYIKID
jgi:hypothetical protein